MQDALRAPAEKRAQGGASRERVAGSALLVGSVIVAYGVAIPNFFVSDDLDMLSGDASDLFWPAAGFGRFMPLAGAVHRSLAVLAGLNPIPAHTLQVALHAGCTLAVYALARAVHLERAQALAAALLFALYPRHHQVVMWFGAVSIGLAAALALATALLFLRAWGKSDARAGWLAVVTYTGALLAHESAVAMPLLLAALALHERRAGQRCSWAAPPRWLWAMGGVMLVHLGLVAWAYQARAALYPDSGYRFIGLGGELAASALCYAARLVAPPPWTEPLTEGPLGLALGLLVLLAGGWGLRRGSAPLRLGLGWAVMAAAPFVLFGVYGVTDRYYYLPSVGVALALAALPARRRLGVVALVAYSAGAILLLGQAAAEWRAAGDTVRATMAYLADWAEAHRRASTPPEAVLFVGVPFKRGERWPGSQVYVFSTGIVGAAHLATGAPGLRVSYLFADERPELTASLAGRPPAPGPPGLHLLALDTAPPTDHTAVLGAALPELAALRWRGASRTPVDWAQYLGADRQDARARR
jgi:hypothetical protein